MAGFVHLLSVRDEEAACKISRMICTYSIVGMNMRQKGTRILRTYRVGLLIRPILNYLQKLALFS